MPSHHMDHIQLPNQIVGDKILPVHPLHGVKGGHYHLLDAVVPAHEPDSIFHTAQQRDHLSSDDGGRASVERKGAGSGLQLVGGSPHRPEQLSVAQMNPVEKTQGNHTFWFICHISFLLCRPTACVRALFP